MGRKSCGRWISVYLQSTTRLRREMAATKHSLYNYIPKGSLIKQTWRVSDVHSNQQCLRTLGCPYRYTPFMESFTHSGWALFARARQTLL